MNVFVHIFCQRGIAATIQAVGMTCDENEKEFEIAG
jgi:hypothetical protein